MAPSDVGAVDHVEAPARLQRVEVGRLDDEAEVVGVLAGARHLEQVDERAGSMRTDGKKTS